MKASYRSLVKVSKPLITLLCITSGTAITQLHAAILVPYNPQATANVSAPIVGIAQGEINGEDKYLLTRNGAW